MKTSTYSLTFLTPAFLGDAEQHGRWRTPPIKALLRQWWRVVYAADQGFNVDVENMRREEGLLFGNAWLSHKENGREITDHRKSLVRLRLDRWEAGTLRKGQWPQDTTVHHPEVPKPVGSALYLGYGPLEFKAGTQLKANAAIQAGEHATLSVAAPEEHVPSIQRAIWLMDRYGTLGGRSRNGWGSFTLTPVNGTPQLDGQVPLRDWEECLSTDWPQAIGKDTKGPLIWETTPHDDWNALMKTLAEIKIGLRTQRPKFELTLNKAAGDEELINKKTGERRGINHGAPQARHWLSYPVTNHTVRPWGNNARLPNQIRFKVRRAPDGKLFGVIFHMPCRPTPEFRPAVQAIENVWKHVHDFLDAPAQQLTRIQE